MSYELSLLFVSLSLFVGMLLLLEIGRRIGLRHAAEDPEASTAGLGAIDGAVFGVMGLLLAFTFSGAASRFDTRRQLIVEEANDIGTAYLRLDLLPAASQPGLRDSFRRYVDSRVAMYRKLPGIEEARAEFANTNRLQQEIWSQAVAACGDAASPATTTLVLSALNEMMDITGKRTAALQMHPPGIIFVMLFGLALTSSMLAGYDMAAGRSRSWVHIVGFAAVMALAVYTILDIEFPRLGLIQVESFDHLLVEVRESMDRP